MYKNKKGVAELTTFVLLLLVIVIAATSAYLFSKNVIQNDIYKYDSYHMLTYLNQLSQRLNYITSFDGSSTSMNFFYNSGQLILSGNQIRFQSLLQYTGTNNCLNSVCYSSLNDFEKIYYNLPNGFTFSQNLTLNPGQYLLSFTSDQNAKKIKIEIR